MGSAGCALRAVWETPSRHPAEPTPLPPGLFSQAVQGEGLARTEKQPGELGFPRFHPRDGIWGVFPAVKPTDPFPASGAFQRGGGEKRGLSEPQGAPAPLGRNPEGADPAGDLQDGQGAGEQHTENLVQHSSPGLAARQSQGIYPFPKHGKARRITPIEYTRDGPTPAAPGIHLPTKNMELW